MLDRRTDKLLKKLNVLCPTSGFCLVEEGELSEEKEDSESIQGMLGFLRDRGFLDLQYADKGEYCVRILPQGRQYHERAKRERLDELKKRRSVALSAGMGAFFGAFIAGMVAAFLIFGLFK